MIEVRNISKKFGEKEVLNHISTKFEKGVTNLIIGSSGSGKTTLLKCMVGLQDADAGEVLYDGKEFIAMNFAQKVEIRKEIGMLFQNSALFDNMNVEDNIRFPLDMFTTWNEADKRKRVEFCLERVNLKNTNSLSVSELSGGMKKRVGIARAIALQPKYLFCDEPNSGLDPKTAILIDELINEITKEYDITTVVVTHDMNSVMGIGGHIVFLNQGQNWWEGDYTEIMNTQNEELKSFVFAGKFTRKFIK